MFQSQAGFVPLCDGHFSGLSFSFGNVSIPGGICSSLRRPTHLPSRPRVHVSIPGGICSSLRQFEQRGGIEAAGGFNPRRDLFLFATMSLYLGGYGLVVFQSQAGFVPLCDFIEQSAWAAILKVSIPGGICSSLRRCPVTLPTRRALVSIPGGICSSLRLHAALIKLR